MKFFQLVNDLFTPLQIDAHVGGVNDLAFSYPNRQLCVVTCGDDKLIKVTENFRICNNCSQMNVSLIIKFEECDRCGI